MPLSAFRAQPGKDRALAAALIELEEGSCPGCGQPKDEAWRPEDDDEMTGWYDGHAFICASCEVLADTDAGGKSHRPGRKVFTTLARDLAADPPPPWVMPGTT